MTKKTWLGGMEMNDKTIKNMCRIGNKCVLEVDGKYFGYDNDPAYPETLYKNIEEAYVFKSQSNALEITSWLSGRCFKLIPV